MRNRFPIVVVLLMVVSSAVAEEAPCECVEARSHHGWCQACGVGFIAGLEIHSRTLWEALDAHGHNLDPAGLTCATCAAAYLAGGFCEEHFLGFVAGQAYYSRLTYHIAKGETTDPSKTACLACRKHAEAHGWCDADSVGMIGNVAIRDRQDYEDAAHAFKVLLSARELVDTCELCGAAMAIDGRCPVHKLSYKDGVGSESP